MISAILFIALVLYIKKIQDSQIQAGIIDFPSLVKRNRNTFLFVLSLAFLFVFIANFFPYRLLSLLIGLIGLTLMFYLSAKAYAHYQNNHPYSNFPIEYVGPTFKLTTLVGGAFVIITSSAFLDHHDYYGHGFLDFLPIFLMGPIVAGMGTILMLILSYFVLWLFKIFPKKKIKQQYSNNQSYSWSAKLFTHKKKNSNKIRPSHDKIQHYQAQGLDSHEIDYFRTEMATSRDQIFSIENSINQTAKLRAIATRNNTIKVCQTFFADIVNEPQRLAEAGQFLYKFLPSLEDLVKKYNEVNSHVAKNKQTYQILDKTAQMIELLCKQINDEYILFHKNTYNELNDELKLAELNIQRRNSNGSEAVNNPDELFSNDILGGETDDRQAE